MPRRPRRAAATGALARIGVSMVSEALRQIGLILAAGLVSVPIAALLRVPLMVVLVGAGVLIGP